MSEKNNEGMGNIYTAVGGALLGMGIADQLVKCIAPAIQKLQSGEPLEQLKLLSGEQEHEKEEKKEPNEIAELKRKLQEYEEKAKGQHE